MRSDDANTIRQARLERVRVIRRRVVGGAMALFLAMWVLITVNLVTGHDPALAREKVAESTAAQTTTAGTGGSGNSGTGTTTTTSAGAPATSSRTTTSTSTPATTTTSTPTTSAAATSSSTGSSSSASVTPVTSGQS
ncbi:MAG: hypothetical protein ABSH51_05785 [Solirubrobacteraceae bacterium]